MSSIGRLLPLTLLLGCSGKSDTGGEAGGGAAEEPLEAPLDNGPGDSLVMSASCAPDDGRAWQLVIGLGSGCDMAAPDPTQPFARITVYHPDLLATPVGTPVQWTDFDHGQGSFHPTGSSGPGGVAPSGSLYLSSWDGAGTGSPPEGGAVSGWYTLTLEDGSELGAAFDGVWCGGDPMCG